MNRSGICDCCTGISVQPPVAIDNRPGLPSVPFRIGTWATFKARMLAQLSQTPGLLPLRTRSDDDFSIALLDAWAVACDILTFYSERGWNENHLRTATELVSVTELAKLIGYKARPGVAAAVDLAFTLESPPTIPPSPIARRTQENAVPSKIVLAAGTQVRSVPGPGEDAVTFETSAPIEARYAWNEMKPRLTWLPDDGTENLSANVRLAGLFGDLKRGDMLLVVARSVPAKPSVQRVASVTLDSASQTTYVTFDGGGVLTPSPQPPATTALVSGDVLDSVLWGTVKRKVWPDQTDFIAQAVALGIDVDALETDINTLRGKVSPQPPESSIAPVRVFRLGIRASLFGHNAPLWDALPASLRFITDGKPPPFPESWEGYTLDDDIPNRFLRAVGASSKTAPKSGLPTPNVGETRDGFRKETDRNETVDLDSVYPSIGHGDYLVLQAPDGTSAIVPVLGAVELTRSDYLISAKISRIELDLPIIVLGTSGPLASFLIRTTRVLATSGELPVAPIIIQDSVTGSVLPLDTAQLGLKVKQRVIVTGQLAKTEGETASESATIVALALVDGYTELTLDPQLSNAYVRSSVSINANVAPATHGESRSEIVGSGDATRVFQRCKLNAIPLTYTSAATPSGVASTLTVRMNGVAWSEVDWLYGHGPIERIYTTMVDESGNRLVQFGDGTENGSRTVSGANNIIALYRQGLGSGGNVRAGQLSMLQSRPLGLKGANNPLPATGGADPETAASARTNAPLTVRALDRIVSLEDFGDFARSSGGIAKAAASWLWTGTHQAVCVTVAGPGGKAIPAGTLTYRNLLAAMNAVSDGMTPTVLRSYVARTFDVAASIVVDPTLDPVTVLGAVKDALRSAFSFDAREFAQPVFRSEVIAVMQDVRGVIALTLNGFGYTGQLQNPQADGLVALGPISTPARLNGATLLTLASGLLPGVVVAS